MQKVFDLVKSSNFYAPSKYVQMAPFWSTTKFNGVWVRGSDMTSNPEHDNSVVRILTCIRGIKSLRE